MSGVAVAAYDFGMRVADRAGLRRARARLAGAAVGDVLEIGIGTGLNLGLYPSGASLHAIDPSAPAIEVAHARAARLGRQVTLVVGEAEALPFRDDSFDVVVGTFVLCTVRDVATTLAEVRRVLRDGGTLRVMEHGRSERASVARLQTLMAPSWAVMAGGCRLDHDVRGAITTAGFRVVEERSRGDGVLVEVVASPG
jgi:ubiquinone/menaquinone biosynthesis C-methylase UbiE